MGYLQLSLRFLQHENFKKRMERNEIVNYIANRTYSW
jgi:hypothetical protein